ncbi:MAG: hypothetical protein ACNFW9_06310 [Candidatus Kerfeldbacteria bacterium]
MNLPLAPLIDLLISVICFFCSWQLYRSYKRDNSHIVLFYFFQAYAVIMLSYLFFAIPRLTFPENSLYIGIGFVVAQAFLYIGMAFFAKVTTFFVKVYWSKRVFWLVIFASVMAIIINIAFFTYPIYNSVTGLTDWNIHPWVGISSTIVLVGILAPSSLFFFWQGFKSRDNVVKIRSISLAIGLVSLMITAYIYYSATTVTVTLISDLLSLLSFLIVFFGVIYKRGNNVNNISDKSKI